MASGDPGLLGGVLIAMAAGWIVRRLLRRRTDVFRCLALGLAGALLGLLATGAAGAPVTNALGLFAAATGGAAFVQGAAILLARG